MNRRQFIRHAVNTLGGLVIFGRQVLCNSADTPVVLNNEEYLYILNNDALANSYPSSSSSLSSAGLPDDGTRFDDDGNEYKLEEISFVTWMEIPMTLLEETEDWREDGH